MLIPMRSFYSAGGIAPNEITTATLKFWVKSDTDLTLEDTDRVQAWGDQSSGGNDLTVGTGTANRPTVQSAAINGYNGIRFDGTDDYLAVSASLATTGDAQSGKVHCFAVLKTVSWGANDYLLTLNSGSNRQIRHHTSAPQIRQSGSVSNVNAVSPSVGSWCLLQSGFHGGTTSFQVLNDGSKVTGASEGSNQNTDKITLGASSSPSNYGNVEYAELCIFWGELTDSAELAGLLDYFNNKYALWS